MFVVVYAGAVRSSGEYNGEAIESEKTYLTVARPAMSETESSSGSSALFVKRRCSAEENGVAGRKMRRRGWRGWGMMDVCAWGTSGGWAGPL